MIPSHTVTFNSNGGTGTLSNQVSNIPAALTTNTFTQTGYIFSGWNTAANGTGTAYADGAIYSFAADITLYAQWTVIPSHTVSFNSNGGTGTMSNQVSNVPAALTTNTFTYAGYTFSGWSTAANGTGTAYADGATYSFSADVTLYAQWTVIPSHTVTFNANGGTGTMSNQVSNVPAALTTNTFTQTGYTFSGWNTAANGTGTAYADGATYGFAADVTLYAQWTVIPSHTVTFNTNGGTGTMSNQGSNVPAALTTNTFTDAGYTFSGWNTTANGTGTAYADGATYGFAADVTLYAQWTVIPSHTVTFNSNGGTGTMSNQVSNVPAALTTNTFTQTGYTFSGWSTAANGTGTAYADGAIYSFAADVTLYAQWTVIPSHTVTFNSNGGTGTMSNQVSNIPAALTTNTFTKTGYTFSGWNTAANGTGAAYAEGAIYSFAADVTLYAQWSDFCTSVTEIPQSECEALVALYNSTNGASWKTNTNWLQTNTPCSWYGVTCGNGHVTQLILDNNQMSGSIPPELGNLTNLTYLDLEIDYLSGSIPPELGNLTNLTYLNLSNNKLSGSIPSELGNLSNLTDLVLSTNQLSGNIPPELGNLTNLAVLQPQS